MASSKEDWVLNSETSLTNAALLMRISSPPPVMAEIHSAAACDEKFSQRYLVLEAMVFTCSDAKSPTSPAITWTLLSPIFCTFAFKGVGFLASPITILDGFLDKSSRNANCNVSERIKLKHRLGLTYSEPLARSRDNVGSHA